MPSNADDYKYAPEYDTESDATLASQYDNYRTPSQIAAAQARTEGYNAGYAQAVADMKAARLAESEQMVRRCQRQGVAK